MILAWRALLFVPADAPKFIASAVRHRPDAVLLDFEDSVKAENRAAARASAGSALTAFAAAGIGCAVRLNSGLRDMLADIDAIADVPIAALLVPKCEDDRPLRNAAEARRGNCPLIALIETPGALARLEEIAAAPDVAALMFGSEDYAAALGVSPDSPAMEFPCMRIAAAAAAAGIAAFGMPGSIADYSDLDRFKSAARRGRDMGMHGAAAVHPAQLPALREAFAADQHEVEWAHQALSAFEAAGGGVATLDGRMLDAPVIARARRLLQVSGA